MASRHLLALWEKATPVESITLSGDFLDLIACPYTYLTHTGHDHLVRKAQRYHQLDTVGV